MNVPIGTGGRPGRRRGGDRLTTAILQATRLTYEHGRAVGTVAIANVSACCADAFLIPPTRRCSDTLRPAVKLDAAAPDQVQIRWLVGHRAGPDDIANVPRNLAPARARAHPDRTAVVARPLTTSEGGI